MSYPRFRLYESAFGFQRAVSLGEASARACLSAADLFPHDGA